MSNRDDELQDMTYQENKIAEETCPMSIGNRVNRIFELRNRKSELEAEIKEINAEIDSIEYGVILDMEAQGLDKLTCNGGTASLKVELYPKVDDRAAWLQWCYSTGNTDMIQAKCNSASFKAYFESEGGYPDGIDAYQRKTLGFRRAR